MKVCSGVDIKVIELTAVAKILIPTAHPGKLPSALKKASELLPDFLMKELPKTNINNK